MQVNAHFTCLLLIVFLNAVISSAQIKMDLRDVSDDDAPIRISGTVTVDENNSPERILYTYRTKGSITNLSDKPILITAIRLSTDCLNAPPLQHEHEVDRFFGPEVLESGHAESLEPPLAGLGRPTINGVLQPDDPDCQIGPTATAEVTFVQFID